MEMIIGLICFLIYLKIGSLIPFEGDLPLLTKIILLIFWLPLFIYMTIGINVKKDFKGIQFDQKGRIRFSQKK
ncbi:hypothetical protein [Metabacillus sp. SLBN-84]